MANTDGQRIMHDAYFTKKPAVFGLMTVRLALLCTLCVSAVLFFADLYYFTVDRFLIAGAAAAMTAVVFVLASVLPSSAVYLGITALAAAAGFFFRKPLIKYAGYFWDYMMLRLDSRLLKTKDLVINDAFRLNHGYLDDEMMAGCLLAALVFAFLCAVVFTAAFRTRIKPFYPVLLIGIVCVPAFGAEIAGFHNSVVPLAASFGALLAIGSSYRLDSDMVFGNPLAARVAVHRGESQYRKRTRFYIFGRKLKEDASRYMKYTANGFAAFLLCAAVFACAAAAVPEGQGLNAQMLIEKVTDMSIEVADRIGNIIGKSFGNADEKDYFSNNSAIGNNDEIGLSAPSDSNMPVLDVVLERNDVPVYLRGDIGVDFNGKGWSVIGDVYGDYAAPGGESYEKLLSDYYPEAEYQVFRQILSRYGYNPDEVMPLQKISVTYRRNSRVVFQPLATYELNYRDSDYYDSYGDYVLRLKPSSGYIKTYECLSLTPNITKPAAVTNAETWTGTNITPPEGVSADRYSEYIENYRGFVNSAYTKTDDRVKDFVSMLYTKGVLKTGMDKYTAAEAICEYFKNNFTYSLTVDNGDDAISGFLYETKEGHCALFASAMTLVLREIGIPARYVTGYVAYGEGEPAEGGYRYTLREKDLHAWVEVYFMNAGWLPFDPTAAVPGFGEEEQTPEVTDGMPEDTTAPPENTTADNAAGSSQNETAENTETAETTESTLTPPESTAAAERVPAKTEDKLLKYLPFIVIALVIAFVILLTVMFIRSVFKAEKRVFAAFRKRPPSEAVCLMYRFLIELYTLEGLQPEGEQFYEYAQRIDRHIIMKGLNLFLMDVMPIFEKCEFGTPEISPAEEEERRAVYRLVTAVYGRIVGRYNPIKRFFVKISLFLH
ncbi:MAG: transglutaminase family protein [Ruminiclostridium sp.]